MLNILATSGKSFESAYTIHSLFLPFLLFLLTWTNSPLWYLIISLPESWAVSTETVEEQDSPSEDHSEQVQPWQPLGGRAGRRRQRPHGRGGQGIMLGVIMACIVGWCELELLLKSPNPQANYGSLIIPEQLLSTICWS